MVIQWNANDRRLTVVEEQAKQSTSMLTESRQQSRDSIRDVQGDVKEIKAAVNAMQAQLAVQGYQMQQAQPQPQQSQQMMPPRLRSN